MQYRCKRSPEVIFTLPREIKTGETHDQKTARTRDERGRSIFFGRGFQSIRLTALSFSSSFRGFQVAPISSLHAHPHPSLTFPSQRLATAQRKPTLGDCRCRLTRPGHQDSPSRLLRVSVYGSHPFLRASSSQPVGQLLSSSAVGGNRHFRKSPLRSLSPPTTSPQRSAARA